MISIPSEIAVPGFVLRRAFTLRDLMTATEPEACGEFMGFPVIVDPLMPKNEIRLRTRESEVRIIVGEG